MSGAKKSKKQQPAKLAYVACACTCALYKARKEVPSVTCTVLDALMDKVLGQARPVPEHGHADVMVRPVVVTKDVWEPLPLRSSFNYSLP
jgi:hypothetical protein